MISDLILYIQTNLNAKQQMIFIILILIITLTLYIVDKKIDNKKTDNNKQLKLKNVQ